MRVSRWIAAWMMVGALGIVAMGAGCGDDTENGGTSTTTASTTASGTGGSGGMGTGGTGGMGTGGSGGDGTGGSGGMGAGGSGGMGTGGSGGMMGQNFSFTMNGTNYNPHVGSMVYVTAVAVGDSTVMPIGSVIVANDGTFTVTGQLLGDQAYTVGYYADINDNQTCDPAPTDHVWTEDIPTVIADVTLNVQHNVNFAACQ